MRLSAVRLWTLGAVGGVVVVLAAVWLLLVSPTLAAASTIRTEADSVQTSNDDRQATLVALKKDFENLSSLRADLADLRSAVPEGADVPAFLRQLQEAAAAHQVTLKGVSVQTPENVDPVTGQAVVPGTAPAPTDQTDATDQAAAAPQTGLVQIPVSIEASGERANLDAFLSDVQQGMDRLVLVDSVSEARVDQEGEPPYTDTLTGRLLVLPN
jgi:Tfp pilus assembly protein PilO